MPYYRLFYHLVWATKYRLPMITDEIEKHLYPYLSQKACEIECRTLAANGWNDHLHLIVAIPPKISISQVVKRLKGASSHEFEELYWQRGYGALTVGERNLDVAIGYVNTQKEHHSQQTTIARLERCDDDPDEDNKILREENGVYGIEEEILII